MSLDHGYKKPYVIVVTKRKTRPERKESISLFMKRICKSIKNANKKVIRIILGFHKKKIGHEHGQTHSSFHF